MTTVRIADADGVPVSGFPLRFELDDGMEQRTLLGMPLGSTLETTTNTAGYASISYNFKARQPADWKIRLLNAERLPDQNVHVIPLRDLPRGSRISVATPNP